MPRRRVQDTGGMAPRNHRSRYDGLETFRVMVDARILLLHGQRQTKNSESRNGTK
jgi:hypothetical protein